MKSEEFNEIIEAAIIKIQQTLLKKGTEYAPGADTDRLANFRKAAHLQGVNMKQALQGMLAKHTVSIADMIASGEDYPQAVWDEKIGDSLVYHLLLTAVVWEEKNQDWTEEDLHKNDVALPSVEESPDKVFDTWAEFYAFHGRGALTEVGTEDNYDVIVKSAAFPFLKLVYAPTKNEKPRKANTFAPGA